MTHTEEVSRIRGALHWLEHSRHLAWSLFRTKGVEKMAIEIATKSTAYVNRKDLATALKALKGTVATRFPLPICTHVKLESDGRRLTLTTTDFEKVSYLRVPANVESAWSVCVPYKDFAATARNLKASTFRLTATDTALSVDADGASLTLHGMAAKDYPFVPEPDGQHAWLVDAEILADIARKTVPFAADDDTRPALCGVYVECGDGISAVATNGFVLGTVDTAHILTDTPEGKRFLLPASAVKALPDFFTAENVEIRLRIGQTGRASFVHFSGKSTGRVFTTRTMDGTYPNYRQIIPNRFAGSMYANRASLLTAIKSTLGADKGRMVRLSLSGDTLTVTGEDATTLGRGRYGARYDTDKRPHNTAQVRVGGVEGTCEPIAFNSHYLTAALNTTADEIVAIRLNKSTQAAVIEPTTERSVVVLMPMHG